LTGEVTFADEPFPCPECGQMLASTCRVCVACHHPVVHRHGPRADSAPSVSGSRIVAPPEHVRFPWILSLLLLGGWFVAAHVALELLGVLKGQIVLSSFVMLSSAWVFYDACERHVPKPLRWGIGSLLLWIVVFPWYLVRRRTPQARCPFIEAEVGPITRAVLVVLLVLFLLSVVLTVWHGPLAR